MKFESVFAAIVITAAPTLIAAAIFYAISVPRILPAFPLTDEHPMEGYTESAIPRCVLSHSQRGPEEQLFACKACDDSDEPSLSDILAGSSGACAKLSDITIPFDNQVNDLDLRCAHLSNVEIRSTNTIKGANLSFAILRNVTIKANTRNAVFQCADMRNGALVGEFKETDFGGAWLKGVNLQKATFLDLLAAHAMIDTNYWPLATAGVGTIPPIKFSRPKEAATLLPSNVKLDENEGIVQVSPSDKTTALRELHQRVDSKTAPFLASRIEALEAGQVARWRRLFASNPGHTLLSIGAVWGFATLIFLAIIFYDSNRPLNTSAITRRGTGAVPWVRPPKRHSIRIATAGWAGLQALWGIVGQLMARYDALVAPPGLKSAVGAIRLQKEAAWVAWCTSITAGAVALLGWPNWL